MVIADSRLVVRSAPGTGSDSTILSTRLYPGQQITVEEGPILAAGYAWYRIHADQVDGWVAAASRTSEPWLAPTSGTWTGLHWIASPSESGLCGEFGCRTFTLFGWSRGYVSFGYAGDTHSIVSATSTDGFHWTRGGSLDVAGVEVPLPEGLYEGPTGLLAVGRPEGVCGWPDIAALWTSRDGVSWEPVSLPRAFGQGRVATVSGGTAGYIATGYYGDVHAVWVSSDGRTWHRVTLPDTAPGKLDLNGAVAFAKGFVLAGAVILTHSCGDPPPKSPSLWWSQDGAAWSRATVRGATQGGAMTVDRISDRALLATEQTWDVKTRSLTRALWASSDGRVWKSIPAAILPAGRLLTDGQRGVVVGAAADNSSFIAAFDDDLHPVLLDETGDLPGDYWRLALGPAGVIGANAKGTRFWLGIPTAWPTSR